VVEQGNVAPLHSGSNDSRMGVVVRDSVIHIDKHLKLREKLDRKAHKNIIKQASNWVFHYYEIIGTKKEADDEYFQ
jgi:hypothetical protein